MRDWRSNERGDRTIMGIIAIRIDSREPGWVKDLSFGGVAKTVEKLETGDAEVWLESGEVLLIERKTVEDLLGSIADNRLFAQGKRLAELRTVQQISGQRVTTLPYVLVTGEMTQSLNNKVITARGETSWHWESVNSSLLSLQEIGVFVVTARGDADYERAVIALANRKRNDIRVYATRDILLGDKKVEFLMGLPAIGEERAKKLLERAGGELFAALVAVTDKTFDLPIGPSLQKSIRNFLGLPDGVMLGITTEDDE